MIRVFIFGEHENREIAVDADSVKYGDKDTLDLFKGEEKMGSFNLEYLVGYIVKK